MRNMFVKALSLGAMALLTAGWGSAAQAQSITGSSHDLRLEVTSGPATAQICVFCHTPHNTTAPEAPLWNRNPPAQDAGGWTMYSSSTLDMTIAAAPQGVSAGCLSCHDGITAYDSLINNPSALTAPGTMGAANPLAVGSGGDLSNDHPISITYDTAADPDFNAAVSGQVNGLPLYDAPGGGVTFDQVECGSCHNPHDVTFGTFLRVSNQDSALCLSCHAK